MVEFQRQLAIGGGYLRWGDDDSCLLPIPGALSAPGSAVDAMVQDHSGRGSPWPAAAVCDRQARRSSGCRSKPGPLSRRTRRWFADGCRPCSTSRDRSVMCKLRRQKTVVCGSTSRCSRAAARNNGLRMEPGVLSCASSPFTVASKRPLVISTTTPTAGVEPNAEDRAACTGVSAAKVKEKESIVRSKKETAGPKKISV